MTIGMHLLSLEILGMCTIKVFSTQCVIFPYPKFVSDNNSFKYKYWIRNVKIFIKDKLL